MQNKDQDTQSQPQPQLVGQAPVDSASPYQQQPVNQQYFAQPQAAPVQYVVMAESLKGVKGWLLFFVIAFALSSLSYIGNFFNSMNSLSDASSVVSLIFSPLMAAGCLLSTIFIAQEKKLGKLFAVGTLGLGALFSVVNTVTIAVSKSIGSGEISLLISAIITAAVIQGLLALYFFVSKRVKETLVK